jgi:hypothetical protein
MQIERLAAVDRDGHPGMGDLFPKVELGLPVSGKKQVRQRFGVVGELDEIKGEVRAIPKGAPFFDQTSHEFAVEIGVLGIGLALIPQNAPDGVWNQRRQHTVMHRGGFPTEKRIVELGGIELVFQGLFSNPSFRPRSAVGTIDQPDGNVFQFLRLAEFPREVPGDR